MVVLQCAQLSNNLLLVQKCTVRLVAKYFTSTSTHMYLLYWTCCLSTHGVLYKPDKEKGIECYVDANFSGVWDQ